MLTVTFVRSNLLYCLLGIGGLCLLISGNLLRSLGIHDIFRDPAGSLTEMSFNSIVNSRAFAVQFYAAIFISTVFTCFASSIGRVFEGQPTSLRQGARYFVAYLPLPLLVLFSATLLADDWAWPAGRYRLISAVAGFAIAQLPSFAWFYLVAWLNKEATPGKSNESILLNLAALFVVCVGFMFNPLTPADAFFTIFGWITLAYLVAFYAPGWLLFTSIGVLVALRMIVWLLPYEPGTAPYQLDGFRDARSVSYYREGNQASLISPGQWIARGCSGSSSCRRRSPVELLSAWQTRRRLAKPKVVLVAASGGAYRATFWTVHMLDHLIELSRAEGKLEGLADHIRLATGASGGMVGATYFAVCGGDSKPTEHRRLARIIERDIIEPRVASQCETIGAEEARPIDSLLPIADHLARRDIIDALVPRHRGDDRGVILERQWRSIAISFDQMLELQDRYLRPAVIFSPTIVELGTPLVITSLLWSERGKSAVILG